MRTYVYVDGFNLYYRAIKHTRFKWLDLAALCEATLDSRHEVACIKYFTARIWRTDRDPSKHTRQDIYLRALKAYLPQIEILYGRFQRRPVRMPTEEVGKMVTVVKTEEKGSDVNLATHLLNDAWLDVYDCGIVLSNDSDLAESMRLVKRHHPLKSIGLLSPSSKSPSAHLNKYADFVRHIRVSELRRSQLPVFIPGTNIRKPDIW